MVIYCTGEFISEVKLLLRNKSYSDCEEAIISEVFQKTAEEVQKGSKRIGGVKNKSPFL